MAQKAAFWGKGFGKLVFIIGEGEPSPALFEYGEFSPSADGNKTYIPPPNLEN